MGPDAELPVDPRLVTLDDLAAAGEPVTPRTTLNGPCMVFVPDGTPGKLDDYYLYFADHGGDHIRMAHAPTPMGPFALYRPGRGVLTLSGSDDDPCGADQGRRGLLRFPGDSGLAVGQHIASPDVRLDPMTGRFEMIYHGFAYHRQPGGDWVRGQQRSFAAWSEDGLDFQAGQYGVDLWASYLRRFWYRDRWWGVGMGGIPVLPEDPGHPYASPWRRAADAGRTLGAQLSRLIGRPVDPRHHALLVDGDTLIWVVTLRREPKRVIDALGASEAIYAAVVRLDEAPDRWRLTEVGLVLKPELLCEGAYCPTAPSQPGAPRDDNGALSRVNELRDPDVFVDPRGGRAYLYYAVAGESGIAVAQWPPPLP